MMTPRPYDLQVAAQLELLKVFGLAIHIPKKGPPYFTRKTR